MAEAKDGKKPEKMGLLLPMGIAAAGFFTGWLTSDIRKDYRNEQNPAIQMKLPLEGRPSFLQYDYLVDKAQIKVKFDRNYLSAFKERYEKLQFEAYVRGRVVVSDTMELSLLNPDVPRVYGVPAEPSPEKLPIKIIGIKKNGTKEAIFPKD